MNTALTTQVSRIWVDDRCCANATQCTHQVSIEIDGEYLFLGELPGAEILRLMAATKAQTMGMANR